MFWLQFISKFIKVLRSGESPPLIAGGFVMGFVVGLTPFLTLQNVVILLLAFLTKVNLASVFFSIFLFSFVAYIFDPVFHDLGFFLLTQVDALTSAWIAAYNWPVAPLTRFNNTVVMGSLTSALVLLFPVYFLFKKGIVAYRAGWAERIEKSKFMKAFKGNVVVKWYLKVRDLEF
jgi:uncharacterized protein (TIGR03546 family)